MDLSIIIVNWNSVEYLKKCLESIYKETRSMQYEIVVVDNASYDGSDIVLENDFPEVIFIQSEENIGFARANNHGYENSSGRNLLFLNPDTEILDSAIDVMHSHLESIDDVGAVGCKILNSDLTLDISCVRPFPFIMNSLFESQYLIARFPKVKLWKSNPLFPENRAPRKVEVILGACIMIKRKIFEDIQMFSTDYFMYSEDVDLCCKVNQTDCNLYYVSHASIIHHGGGSTKNKTRNDFKEVMIQESRLRFIKKMKGEIYANLFRLTTVIVAICRLALILPLTRLARDKDKKNAWKLSLYKWKKILTWSIGLEAWTKKYY